MKYSILSFVFLISFFNGGYAGSRLGEKGHKIVFQLTQGDTLVQKTIVKQINNILTLKPDAKIELVCHGPGLAVLLKEKSIVSDKLDKLVEKGVVVKACEFSMKERKVEKSDLVPAAGTVPSGILEVVAKQEEGWSYIKAGF